MADEEYEIDLYGDENPEQGDVKHEDDQHGYEDDNQKDDHNGHGEYDDGPRDDMDTGHHDDHGYNEEEAPPAPHGVKRKEVSDDRPVDPGATTAIMISDLSWWNTDDDIRGWIRDAGSEDELKDITFSEHKVNGKSKGQAYVEFTSHQAATATKHRIDSIGQEGSSTQKKHSVIYSSPTNNPFRTLPKDAPARAAKDGQTRTPSGPGYQDRSNNMGGGNYGGGGGFRGGRGGFGGPRGGGMGNQGFNRNFSGNANAFNSNMGFNNPMGGGGFGGFRGGMMGGGMRGGGMRGGRGGGMNGMMGGMGPMGPMGPMGGMPGGMGGMGMMGGGMPGFQGMQPHFNPAFFGGGNQGGGDWQNPHGAKRPRPE